MPCKHKMTRGIGNLQEKPVSNESKLVMRRNLWLSFQLSSVYTLHVGVQYVARSYTESVLSIERQMSDQRALFDNLVFSGSISIDRQMIDQRSAND